MHAKRLLLQLLGCLTSHLESRGGREWTVILCRTVEPRQFDSSIRRPRPCRSLTARYAKCFRSFEHHPDSVDQALVPSLPWVLTPNSLCRPGTRTMIDIIVSRLVGDCEIIPA